MRSPTCVARDGAAIAAALALAILVSAALTMPHPAAADGQGTKCSTVEDCPKGHHCYDGRCKCPVS